MNETAPKQSVAKKPDTEKKELWWHLATWFGCGTSPKISGTVGSLGALPLAFLVQYNFGNFALFGTSILIFAIGWWASEKFLQAYPDNQDPKEIVIDEVAGQCLTLCVLFPTWTSYLVGFLLFRLFDIVKPWPVSWADEKVKGALGVMLDDMLAGMYPILIYLLILIEAYFFDTQKLLLPVINFLGGSYVQ